MSDENLIFIHFYRNDKFGVGVTYGSNTYDALRSRCSTTIPAAVPKQTPSENLFLNSNNAAMNRSMDKAHKSVSVPGYAGHIPGQRQSDGTTFGCGASQAASQFNEITQGVLSRMAMLQEKKAEQRPLVMTNKDAHITHKVQIPTFTPRVYSQTVGIPSGSSIYLPMNRFNNVGLPHNIASRKACGRVADRGDNNVSSNATIAPSGSGNASQNSPVRPVVQRQWIV